MQPYFFTALPGLWLRLKYQSQLLSIANFIQK